MNLVVILDVNEKKNFNTTSTRDQQGFFRSVRTVTQELDCTVKFRNGKSLSWHTLDGGPELEKAREVYNQFLHENGHVDIPSVKNGWLKNASSAIKMRAQ